MEGRTLDAARVGRRDGRAHGRRILRDLVSRNAGTPSPTSIAWRRRAVRLIIVDVDEDRWCTGLFDTPSTAAWRGRG
jgi:hypothetical protein